VRTLTKVLSAIVQTIVVPVIDLNFRVVDAKNPTVHEYHTRRVSLWRLVASCVKRLRLFLPNSKPLNALNNSRVFIINKRKLSLA
jgi:hypothetical protein